MSDSAVFIFDYDKLAAIDPEAAADLQKTEADVKGSVRRSLREIIDAGAKLAAAKERHPDYFMAWSSGVFGVHYSTICNWVNTATSMSHAIEAAIAPPLGALYELAESGVDEWRRQLAQRHIDAGTLDKPTAYIYARAPEWMVRKFNAGELPKTATHEFVLEYVKRSTPDEVRLYAAAWLVPAAHCLLYMIDLYKRHKKTEHDEKPSLGWSDIVFHGGHFGGFGWSVHISRATPADIQRHREERQQIRISENAKPTPLGAPVVHYKWLRRRYKVVESAKVKPGRFYIEVDEKTAKSLCADDEILLDMRVVDDEQQ